MSTINANQFDVGLICIGEGAWRAGGGGHEGVEVKRGGRGGRKRLVVPVDCVVVVRTVSSPMETRAGLASTFSQNETHDRMTMSMLGT